MILPQLRLTEENREIYNWVRACFDQLDKENLTRLAKSQKINTDDINSEITTIQGDITTIEGDITTIEGDITTAQSDIDNLQQDVFYHITNPVVSKDITVASPMTMISYDSIKINASNHLKINNGAHLYIKTLHKDTRTLENYSTTDTLTNKYWIDGRQIHRAVINFGALPNNTTKSVAHNLSINQTTTVVVNMYGTSRSTTNHIYLPFNSTTYSYLFIDSVNINMTTDGNLSAYTQTYITIEYVI